MNPEQFIINQLRLKLPDVDQRGIDEALRHYRRSGGSKKGKVFDECLKIAKQHTSKKG